MRIIADANIPFVKECFSSIGEVQTLPGRGITAASLKDADILLVRSVTKVNRELLENSKVQFVATATIGFEHIDLDYLQQRNIGFSSAPGSNANSVAEYVIAALLEIAETKQIELAGKCIGIVGAGNVGSKVAAKAQGLGMHVLLNDPPLQRETGDKKYRPLQELFDCDFITLHTPLTFEGQDKTFHMANAKFFESLTNTPIFINTSRGGVVDTAALKDSITNGKIRACALDVFENEPNIDIEMLKITDLATPHIAGYSYDGKISGLMMIYEAACAHLGISPAIEKESFLPAPQTPEIRLACANLSEQVVVQLAVQELYSIREDDCKLRQCITNCDEQIGSYFESLRKNYGIRREFQNTSIVLDPPNQSLQKTFAGLGFRSK